MLLSENTKGAATYKHSSPRGSWQGPELSWHRMKYISASTTF